MFDTSEFKARQREMWAHGDYHAFATSVLWDLGPILVEACGIGPGQRVLDVAAGTGNVAIRAAEAGAEVIASDLTPENFDAGRREASAHGVEIKWVEADAEALPFGDAEFDVVTSSVGAIFAPNHQAVANELMRVCRPEGKVGLIAIVPDNAIRAMFDIFTRFQPDTMSGPESPLLWGNEEHVREMFGDRVASLSLEHRELSPSPLADIEHFKRDHPAAVSLYRALADQPDRIAELDRAFAEMEQRSGNGHQELLVIVARKRA